MSDHDANRELSDQVQQATRIAAAQLDCSPEDALKQLRIVAAATDQTVDQVAVQVLDGVFRFGE